MNRCLLNGIPDQLLAETTSALRLAAWSGGTAGSLGPAMKVYPVSAPLRAVLEYQKGLCNRKHAKRALAASQATR